MFQLTRVRIALFVLLSALLSDMVLANVGREIEGRVGLKLSSTWSNRKVYRFITKVPLHKERPDRARVYVVTYSKDALHLELVTGQYISWRSMCWIYGDFSYSAHSRSGYESTLHHNKHCLLCFCTDIFPTRNVLTSSDVHRRM